MGIVVVNTSDAAFSDRFNGQDYEFPVGKKVLLPDEAAHHIFGLGESDKTATFARLGWIRTSGEYESAMQRLGKFQFSTFDPYAQLNDVPVASSEHRLSPGADEEAAPALSDGKARAAESAPAARPSPLPKATTSSGILAKLQGA